MLLLEYPLDNTWTYETLFGLLYKDHRTSAPLSKSWWRALPINRATHLHSLTPIHLSWCAPRLPKPFLSVLSENL